MTNDGVTLMNKRTLSSLAALEWSNVKKGVERELNRRVYGVAGRPVIVLNCMPHCHCVLATLRRGKLAYTQQVTLKASPYPVVNCACPLNNAGAKHGNYLRKRRNGKKLKGRGVER